MVMHRPSCPVIFIVMAAVIGVPALHAWGLSWNITQLTDTNNNNGTQPMSHRIDGERVVWHGNGGSGNADIYFFDGSTTTNLNNTPAINELEPRIDGDHIVWGNGNPSLYEISSATATPIPNAVFDIDVSGNHISWRSPRSGNNFDVFRHRIVVVPPENPQKQISAPASAVRANPQIDGNFVTYLRALSGTDDGIYLYDLANDIRTNLSVHTATDGASAGENRTDGDFVAWTADVSGDKEIFLYQISTDTLTQVTNNSLIDDSPYLDNGQLVWRQLDGNDSEIMHYDAATQLTTPITDNNFTDENPRISEGNIAWQGATGGNDASLEIMLHLGASGQTVQLTDNNTADLNPEISGLNVAWTKQQNFQLSSERDLFFALAVPLPPAVWSGMGLLVASAAVRYANRRRRAFEGV